MERIPVKEQNYDKIIKLFLDKYDQPYKVIECHLNNILNLKEPEVHYSQILNFSAVL